MPEAEQPALVAVGDLHVEGAENRRFVEELRPAHEHDWLIVCGDVGELVADIEWGLGTLARRFEKVLWVPGNHELWTTPSDPVQLRGEARYRHIVRYCQDNGIVTPEDPYPVWSGPGGPVVVAPLFVLYDYSFGVNIAPTKRESLARAHEAGVVCSDEFLLHPDPYPSREEWCRERVRLTEERLTAMAAEGVPPVLVNHFPLLAELTRPLYFPEFAQWCGTLATADWHTRFGAEAVVYGHLHIPRSTVHDGVRFEEVSLGYPRERKRWRRPRTLPRRIVGGGEDR
ncbi:MAG: metallophosphoesterase [Actinomycetota bacterium]|nr:metallophosphoesterase [Actinomycetota bacterium]